MSRSMFGGAVELTARDLERLVGVIYGVRDRVSRLEGIARVLLLLLVTLLAGQVAVVGLLVQVLLR